MRMGASKSRTPRPVTSVRRAPPPARGDAPSVSAPKALTLAILALGLLAVLACNLPGQMSYDSVVQLADGRSGVYNTWHPAVMAWLLGLGDAVLPGTALYVTAVAALLFAGLALLVATRFRVGWGAPVVALLACASPLILLEQGLVWKDVLFADAFVSAFLLLAVADGARRPSLRWSLVAASIALLVLSLLVRQNGLVVVVFGVAALGLVAWRARPDRGGRDRARRAVAVAAGGFCAVVVCALAANALLMTRRAPDDVGASGQLRLLKLYDLVGVEKRFPGLDLSALHASGLDAHVRAGVALYTPLKNDPLMGETGIEHAVSDGAPGLDAAWLGAVLHHPGAWLAHRLEVFRWIYAAPDVTLCAATYTGVDGPPEVLASLGLHSAWRGQDLALGRYARSFVRTPLYSHAWWSALAVVVGGLLVLRGGSGDGVVVALLLGALAYAASYFFIGIACDHRYLYPLDLATMAALLHLATGPYRRVRAAAGAA